jgi:UDP-N-acetylmuramyl pentapeptide phosphotransferase/UDP-N-acetylglucosamine-1-phosphate transferase
MLSDWRKPVRDGGVLAAVGIVVAVALSTFAEHQLQRQQPPLGADARAALLTSIRVNLAFAVAAGVVVWRIIPAAATLLLRAGLGGIDLQKAAPQDGSPRPRVPESLGVAVAAIYLVTLFLFIPLPFAAELGDNNSGATTHLTELLAALLSICCMVFLGFADDVLNLRWRHKFVLPTVASLPLLMVYALTGGNTHVVVPTILRPLVGAALVDVGALYYVYMGALAIFSTNAINILAGVNGVEVGQSLVVAASLLTNNVMLLSTPYYRNHLFSLYLLAPFCGVAAPLLCRFCDCSCDVHLSSLLCCSVGGASAYVTFIQCLFSALCASKSHISQYATSHTAHKQTITGVPRASLSATRSVTSPACCSPSSASSATSARRSRCSYSRRSSIFCTVCRSWRASCHVPATACRASTRKTASCASASAASRETRCRRSPPSSSPR